LKKSPAPAARTGAIVKHLPSLVIAAALAGVVPAAWAAPAATNPVQRCRNLIPMIAEAPPEAPVVDTVTPVGDTGCRYTNLRVGVSKFQGWTVGSLAIDRLDFKRLDAEQLPLTLSVRAEGIYFSPSALPPATAYQMKLTQKPVEVTLDYAFDAKTHVLTVKDFTFRGERIGHLTVTASLGGLDPDKIDPHTPPSEDLAASVSLNTVAVDFDNQGMIELYALLPALAALPNSEDDPEGAIAAAKTQAMAGLVFLAGAGVPKDSIAALGRFIQAMPQPRGPFLLTVAPKPPLTAAELDRFDPDDPAKLTALIKRLNLTITY
jgi:hypothetical protein